ncbi:MAG: cation:dicarboxylase symporter family transporter, partial [Chthoniobacterales bacterium]
MEPTPASSRSGVFGWWNRTPLYARIVGAMVLGVVAGLLLGTRAEPLAIPSKLVLRLLGALAPALILLAIVQALMTAKFEKGTAGRLIRLLLLNTVVAILIGLLVANVIRPGYWSSVSTTVAQSAEPVEAKVGVLQQFLENVPQSLFGPLADNGKVIGVIFLAVAFGLALRQLAAKRSVAPVPELVDIGMAAFVTMLHWIVAVIPLVVFGIVASLIGTKGFGAFHALGGFVIAVLCALTLQAVYYLTRVRFGSWVRPGDLLRGTSDALTMAFSTGSSTATMPVTYECLLRRVGLREKSAS